MTFANQTLNDLRRMVAVIVQDAGGLNFTNDEIDAALRQALADLGSARPLMAAATLTLRQDGRVVRLKDYHAGLPGFDWDVLIVMDVVWRDAGDAGQGSPGNALAGFFVERTGDDARLMLIPARGTPGRGDELRLRYAQKRTISGLDGAAETRLFSGEVVFLARGAAGYLARMGTVDHAESHSAALRTFADRELNAWQACLKTYGKSELARGVPFSAAGWEHAWHAADERGA